MTSHTMMRTSTSLNTIIRRRHSQCPRTSGKADTVSLFLTDTSHCVWPCRSLAIEEARRSGEFMLTSIPVTRKFPLDVHELLELPLLYSLRLVNLGLPVIHPALCEGATTLKTLSLSQNKIVSLPPTFGCMRNLEVLNLSQVCAALPSCQHAKT